MKDLKPTQVPDGSNGYVIWLTGLSGSGKTTISKILDSRLRRKSLRVEVLDGDEMRRQLSPDLGYSRIDRDMHARRVAFISKLLSRNGIISIVALISPYRESRNYARSIIPKFVEVWVKCSTDCCIFRDRKQLYQAALKGELSNVTGIQDPYEYPLQPEITVDSENLNAEQCVDIIMNKLVDLNLLEKQNM